LKFTRETTQALLIRRVSSGAIVIGGQTYEAPIALTPDGLIEALSPPAIEDLEEDHFATLLSTDPEMIILGTGDRNVFPPRELTFALARKGIGLEVMDTPAAARTFNVLAGEGRRLAALLYV
jgi:uncharacterized protein